MRASISVDIYLRANTHGDANARHVRYGRFYRCIGLLVQIRTADPAVNNPELFRLRENRE